MPWRVDELIFGNARGAGIGPNPARQVAWRAGLGDYHAGQTWVQPAIAHDITAVNASATETARAFVVVVVP